MDVLRKWALGRRPRPQNRPFLFQCSAIFCVVYVMLRPELKYEHLLRLRSTEWAWLSLEPWVVSLWFRPADGAPGPAGAERGAAEPRPLLRCAPALFSSPGWCEVRKEAPTQRTGLRRQLMSRADRQAFSQKSTRRVGAAETMRTDGRPRRIHLQGAEWSGRMAGGRRGLVAPQNTFLENIVRRSNGKDRYAARIGCLI